MPTIASGAADTSLPPPADMPVEPVTFAHGPQRAAAQNLSRPTAVASREEACGTTPDLEMEYGDDSGPGIPTWPSGSSMYRSRGGHTSSESRSTTCWCFDPTGRFVRCSRTSSSGPGERKDGCSLVVTGDREFSVLDCGRGVHPEIRARAFTSATTRGVDLQNGCFRFLSCGTLFHT